MTDTYDMTDADYRLYKLRRLAAGLFRTLGLERFAQEVEREQLDDCAEMRVAAFFIDPPMPHGDEFIAAWEEEATKAAARLNP